MRKDVYTLSKIQERLKDESLIVSKKLLCLLIRKQKLTGSTANKKVRKRQKKLMEDYKFINAVMAKLSAPKLSALLPFA